MAKASVQIKSVVSAADKAAALALTVWVLTRAGTSHTSVITPGHKANVSTSQNGNQLCAPAPGTRYC